MENQPMEPMDRELREMSESLYLMYDTPQWKAMNYFLNKWDMQLVERLLSLDPVTQPTLIARSQGNRTGMYWLKQQVENFKVIKDQESKKLAEEFKEEEG